VWISYTFLTPSWRWYEVYAELYQDYISNQWFLLPFRLSPPLLIVLAVHYYLKPLAPPSFVVRVPLIAWCISLGSIIKPCCYLFVMYTHPPSLTSSHPSYPISTGLIMNAATWYSIYCPFFSPSVGYIIFAVTFVKYPGRISTIQQSE
jgi:hypothetical protein